MIHTRYLILGAGPAGLSLANMFLRDGEKDILVLEREREAGGLCRSVMIEGTPFDIGGGHFLDVRDDKVLDFVFSFMEELLPWFRDHKIYGLGRWGEHMHYNSDVVVRRAFSLFLELKKQEYF